MEKSTSHSRARKKSGGQGGEELEMRGATCLSVHVCAYSLCARDREARQRRRPYSGLESVTLRAGVERILLSLRFALCKMGITNTAFT